MKQPMKGKTPAKAAPRGPKMAPPFAAKPKKASSGGKMSSAMKRFAAGKMEC